MRHMPRGGADKEEEEKHDLYTRQGGSIKKRRHANYVIPTYRNTL